MIFFYLQKNKLLFILLWVGILLYPLLFIWQGGDLTDTGFFAINYQSFFENLKIGEINSESVLSDLIGATLLHIFPTVGIIGLIFLELIFLYTIIIVTYLLLRTITEKRILLLFGIFCGIIFFVRFTPFFLSRDIISFLFLIISCYLLIIGLSRKIFLIYLSGIVFALACLARFPNIVLIVMLPLIFTYKTFYREKKISNIHFWIIFKEYTLFILGFISMISLTFIVLNYFSLSRMYLYNLKELLTQNESSYSFLDLIGLYIEDCVIFLPHLLIVASLMISTSSIYSYSQITKKKELFLIYTVLLFCIAFLTYHSYSYSSALKYFTPAFCIPPLLFSIIKKDKYSVMVMIILAITLTQVAGSNTGLFLKLNYGFIILLPLSLVLLIEEKSLIFQNITINTKVVFTFGVSLILFFSILARIGWIYHVDSGITSRIRAIYPIEHKLMRGIFTTKNNSIYIKKLSGAIEKNIKEDNSLIIYGHHPMFYYLAKQQPPVKKFWLENNFVQVDEFFNSINESIQSSGKWPLIVDTKQKIMGEAGEKKLSLFLKKNNYIRIVQNKKFTIWNKITP